MFVFIFLSILSACSGGPTATESYKDQYCTDPRTMRKHAAYTEWADAYSCSRHRCQPGGRNLAIYTVGCKRVEAPESAIECEEVVEDTNMQFPYCCTRLRCLVVVRGEVWTRVLGQPWETLPAAPWSHMYKMKKPPPADGTFLPKSPNEGPIYELQTETEHQEPREKVLRASKKTDDFNEAAPRLASTPDIVIALSTANDQKEHKKTETSGNRHKHSRKNSNIPYFETATADPDDNDVAPRAPVPDIVFALSTNNDQKEHKKVESERRTHGRKNNPNSSPFFEEEQIREEGHEPHDEMEDAAVTTEKTPSDQSSDEKYYANAFGVTVSHNHKVSAKTPPRSWTEIPQNQWNERDPSMDAETPEHNNHGEAPEAEKKDEKPGNLQALVDAIGTRMRDIESVVQRMSEKVRVKPTIPPELEFASGEKRNQDQDSVIHKHRNEKDHSKEGKPKKSSTDAEHYKRFSVRNRGSKYLHSATDSTTDQPLFVEDTNLNGYYSDASNSVLRRANAPKEPPATYMAPVETRRKSSHSAPEGSEEVEKKRKKHVHKKKRAKGHHKKHHGKDEKRKRFNRLNSVELDKNVGSLEDSSVAASK